MENKKTKNFLLLVLVAGISFLPKLNFTQETEQEMAKAEGKVFDIDKKPIPKAEVQLRHQDRGQIFSSKTNKNGEFFFNYLPPGKYALRVEKEGYIRFTGEFELRPNTIQKLEVILDREETLEQKKWKEAISSFDSGVKLARENKIDEAIQAFLKAVELRPDFAEAYLDLGILYFRKEKDKEAEDALLKSLELKPEIEKAKEILADIHYEKGKRLLQEDRMDEGLEILQKAYGLRPEHAYVNYLLGYVYFKKEMKNEAIVHFENFLKLEPNSPNAEKVKKLLESIKKQ